MKRSCPNFKCPYHQKFASIVKDGRYFRENDSRWVQRFKCQHCGKRFSASSGTLEWGQKKRRANFPLLKLLVSGVSLRRSALLLKINRKTVERKLIYLAKKARGSHDEFLKRLQNSKVVHLQFDDLITSEHTKLKPLSVTLAVDKQERLLLGTVVSSIPAFGHLAELSRRKYGKRANDHVKGIEQLFQKIKPSIHPRAEIESDEHKAYPGKVKQHFPNAHHLTYKGERGCVAGQGELKRVVHDPLFTLNHTCALLRANINRLIRRTWCTTKNAQRLQDHLDIFTDFYNRQYLAAQLG